MVTESGIGRLVFGIASCFAFAWLASRLVGLVLAKTSARNGRRSPRLLQELIAILLFLSALLMLLALTFDRSLLGVLATSGVLVAVIGFALRGIIADIFYGIAVSLESPYRIGDWIETEPGLRGRVIDINWRSTLIETRNQVRIVLPNSRIGSGQLMNYSAPSPHYRVHVPVTLDFDVPVARAKRVLLAGVGSAPMIRRTPAPDVKVDGYGERGIRYIVRFWLPSFADEIDCRDAVLASIDHHLRIAGIPHGRERVLLDRGHDDDAKPRKRHVDALFRLPAFEGLAPEEIAPLASVAGPIVVAAGAPVLAADEPQEALFILTEGLLAVRDEDGRERTTLQPGEAFGAVSAADAGTRSGFEIVARTDAVLLRTAAPALRSVLSGRKEIAARLAAAAGWQTRLTERAPRETLAELAREGRPRAERLALARLRGWFG